MTRASKIVIVTGANRGLRLETCRQSVCPGWVRTDMGGPRAPRSVEHGAETIVWPAALADGGPTGGFFRDRRGISW